MRLPLSQTLTSLHSSHFLSPCNLGPSPNPAPPSLSYQRLPAGPLLTASPSSRCLLPWYRPFHTFLAFSDVTFPAPLLAPHWGMPVSRLVTHSSLLRWDISFVRAGRVSHSPLCIHCLVRNSHLLLLPSPSFQLRIAQCLHSFVIVWRLSILNKEVTHWPQGFFLL